MSPPTYSQSHDHRCRNEILIGGGGGYSYEKEWLGGPFCGKLHFCGLNFLAHNFLILVPRTLVFVSSYSLLNKLSDDTYMVGL